MLRWASRILLVLLIVILSGVTTGLVLVWSQTHRELISFEERRAQLESELALLQAEREAKEAYLRAFLNDPGFVERVIRDRLGYVAPGELVFRFEEH
ncbi:MAG: septum formation initiator family protein [Oceanipulchritudo sp.]